MRELDADTLLFFDAHPGALPLLDAPEEVDGQLLGWLDEAYAFSERSRKAPGGAMHSAPYA